MVLIITPTKATTIIVTPEIELGLNKRETASDAIPPMTNNRVKALNKAAKIDERRKP